MKFTPESSKAKFWLVCLSATSGLTWHMMTYASEHLLLVTPSEAVEYQGEAGFHMPEVLRPKQPHPVINVLSPTFAEDGKVSTPFPIQVRFVSTSDAKIIPGTFKVFYGALKFDITDRLLNSIKISSDGFDLKDADIPKGKHRMILQIKDEKNRVAEKDLRISVE